MIKNSSLKAVITNAAGAIAILIFGKTIDLAITICSNTLENKGWTFTIAVMGIILFIAIVLRLWNWWMLRSRRKSWIEHRNAEPVKGLIAAVSLGKGETAAETAIKLHTPKLQHCWLLVTKQADDNYQKIYRCYSKYDPWDETQGPRYPSDDGHPIEIHKREIDNPNDIDNVFNVMKGIYREAVDFGISEQDILCDYTGATASVSAAMILVTALSENRNLQYLMPNEVDENGRAKSEKGSTPLLIDFVMPGE
ncbi:hypothetical protein [Syntrophomonas wolfei]|uniref:CRISPR-associated protein n=1 Tax=Syntrophomonas wolfei subsp. wolfei (strain DSM 2245B / Goettingen) TaxID=335541 RepID=Q0ATY6_SYNWW|nr:hypothetical protein [Syntrophomonas wolfei]ABI69818.1 hypothetical protein Swol_2530 [Syntrophomonas wolfei subsp. wolfei str. Goettingen G311]